MTRTEWDGIAALLDNAWRGGMDDDRADAYFALLSDYPGAQVMAALKRLTLVGGPFVPTVPEIVQAITADEKSQALTFDEALVIMRHAWKADTPSGSYADETAMATAKGKAVMARLTDYPLIRAFVERQGLQRLLHNQLDDPDWGERTRRDLEASWHKHCAAFDGREITALASGRRDGFRQVDPLASLRPERLQIEGAE